MKLPKTVVGILGFVARSAALIYKLKERNINVNHTELEYMPIDTADWYKLI